MEDQSKEKKIQETLESIKENINIDMLEEAIVDNELVFPIDGVEYKVIKPSWGEKTQVQEFQVKKYLEMLKDKNIPLEQDLRKTYKERGIDIDEMEKRNRVLEKEKQDAQYKLGELLAKSGIEQDIQIFKNQIIDLQNEQLEILVRKASLLSLSLESQLFNYVYSYLTMLVTYKKEGENWVRLWKTYDDMKAATDELVNKIAAKASVVLRDEINTKA